MASLAERVPAHRPRCPRRPLPGGRGAARRPPLRGGAQPRARARRGRVADPPDRLAASCRACAASPTTSSRRAARGRRGLRPRRGRRAGRDRARDRARRQGRRVLPQAPPGRASSAPASDLTELVHFGCTSEDINNLSYALMVRGAVSEVWLPRAHRAGRRSRRHGPRPARRAAARAHPRPARHADHDGQGARRARAPAAPAAAPHRAPRSTWASSTAPPARTARTSPRCPTRTGRPSAARSSRASA